MTPWGEDAAPCQVAEVAGREAGPRHAPLPRACRALSTRLLGSS